MPTLDDIESNELAIVAFHQGEVSVWKGWKRAICAFYDPQMWKDTSRYGEYFERLDTNEWGMAGYGVIVMDLDNKTTWSFNDFSSPWALFLPNPNDNASNPSEKKAFMALLADPSAWKDVTFDVHQHTLIPGPLKKKELTLEEVLPEGVEASEAFKLLSTSYGEISSKGSRYLVLHGRYLPQDWKVGCEIGEDGPEGLLEALQSWKEAGLPAPSSWEGVDEFMAKWEWPIGDEHFEAYPSEIEEEDEELRDEMREMYDGAQAYRELKSKWSAEGAVVVARPRGP